MTRHLEILKDPPPEVLGTLSADHESNRYRENKEGPVLILDVHRRGGCVLLGALNETPKMRVEEEAKLRQKVRRSLDEVHAGNRPFTGREAAHLLYRLLIYSEKAPSGAAELIAAAKEYLIEYLGGDESAKVIRLLAVYEAERPAEDPKETKRKQQVDAIFKEFGEDEEAAE